MTFDDDDDDEIIILFEDALDELTSIRLDILPRSYRLDTMKEVMEILTNHTNLIVTQQLASSKAPPCFQTLPGSQRLIQVYTKSLELYISSPDTNDDVLKNLLSGFCQVIKQQQRQLYLGKQYQEKLVFYNKQMETIADTLQKISDDSGMIESALWELASNAKDLIAVSLGFYCYNNEKKGDWLDCFLQNTLQKAQPNSKDMELCSILLSKITSEEWASQIQPVVEKKCKASPDKVMDTIRIMISSLNASIDITTSELISLLLKQLKSPKNQVVACTILETLGLNNNSSNAIAESLVSALPTLPQPDQRKRVYEALIKIATEVISNKKEKGDDDVSSILTGLTTAVSKDTTKTAAEAREIGTRALVWWIAVTKRTTKGALPDTALTYFRKTMETSTLEFLSRIGSIFTTLLENNNQKNMSDLVESILLSLFASSSGSKLEQGLQSITEKASSSKKTTAILEGLLSLHLSLLYCLESSSSKSSKLAVSMEKILSSSKAFVYQGLGGGESNSNMTKQQPWLVQYLLPRTIALFVKYQNKKETANSSSLLLPSSKGKRSSATSALAYCLVHANGAANSSASWCLDLISTYETASAMHALTDAIFDMVNQSCLNSEQSRAKIKAARDNYNNEEGLVSTDPKITNTSVIRILGGKLLSLLSPSSAEVITKAWVLLHFGTTGSNNLKKRQRLQLQNKMLKHLTLLTVDDDSVSMVEEIAKVLGRFACGHIVDPDYDNNREEESLEIVSCSKELHEATLSLITSIGLIGGILEDDEEFEDYDVDEEKVADEDKETNTAVIDAARTFCTDQFPLQLQFHLGKALDRVQQLTPFQIGLYQNSRMGTLYELTSNDKNTENNTTERKIHKGRQSEEEEWELQMKKELAAKKGKKDDAEAKGPVKIQLSKEQLEEVKVQDNERQSLDNLLNNLYPSTLKAIQVLCASDIEIGNGCLSLLGPTVMKATITSSLPPSSGLDEKASVFYPLPQIHQLNRTTLEALAACVYEIEESLSGNLTQALLWSCSPSNSFKTTANEKGSTSPLPPTSVTTDDASKQPQLQQFSSGWSIKTLPCPCPVASQVIAELEEFGDVLSSDSYGFCLSLFCATLTGPRTPFIGCAEAVLTLLERHASEQHWCKDVAFAILEFLKHDRSQSVTTSPNALDTLIACYSALGQEEEQEGKPTLSTSTLAPLMDYAIHPTRHCRLGCMKALNALATSSLSVSKMLKKNPLVENRIWVNCFAIEEEVRTEARIVWKALTGGSDGDDELAPPSMLYAIPLLPLLSHEESTISQAAAAANAAAMALHNNKMMERNLTKICSTYIENYPTEDDENEKSTAGTSSSMKAPAAAASKSTTAAKQKKSTSNLTKGLRKTTTKKTDALSLMGKPKKTKKSIGGGGRKLKAVDKALLKPKEERTLDQDALASQFSVNSSSKKEQLKDSPAKTRTRQGMLSAILALTEVKGESTTASGMIELSTLQLITVFLLAYGLADPNTDIRAKARDTLRQIVAFFGSSDEAISFLLPTMEHVLNNGVTPNKDVLDSLLTAKKGQNSTPGTTASVSTTTTAMNRRKEGAVVALGSVALHLKGEDNYSKIDSTVDMLLSTLHSTKTSNNSNESVQSSVADCLVKLMKKGNTPTRLEKPILEDLMRSCLYGEFYSQRRGAAHGIAAVLKGSGIASLKKYNVVAKLQDAATNTGSSNNKEGSLFAMELLSVRLGLLFEPYVIVLLPSLLQCFSDSSDHVRTAATHSADVIMSKLSAHGVKLVLPAILQAFVDPAWRTKQASIQMLGSMSHLAPKQLASALPKVVPKLTEAFSDTHPKVKASAQQALTEITRVIRNPEISSIASTLLLALTDPADGTITALEALIQTEFLHAMDAPSLALIVPVLHRGLRDRIATTKRYAALIAGNICSMIHDAKDFVPYLPLLLPDLQLALLDPIPDVRSTSAKALGSLTRGLGTASGSSSKSASLVDSLRPWLIAKLRQEDITSAERSGAAQGLTEVLIASATTVEKIMVEELLPLRSHPSASTREGVLWVLTFLPSALTGSNFTPALLDSSLPALLNGLSDESEPVRDVAMRAGRVLIRTHGKANVDTILPRLEDGLISDDHRIRLASLSLLGDLLSLMGGTSVHTSSAPHETAATSTQDDFRKAERAQAQLALVLGKETRRSVLSNLYLARSDMQASVRQMAVQVWKTVVAVTARTLRDILPALTNKILTALASGHFEQTQVAGKCLGDVVQKLGDGILPELLPLLQNAILDDGNEATTRRGVCVGLSEVISHASRDAIVNYLELLTDVVRDALCDSVENVRDMAASCFQAMHQVVGQPALDEMVPSLLINLDSSSSEESTRALRGLAGILKLRSRELLPYIIPRLLSNNPITISHTNALSGIAEVTGTTLHVHFHNIIPALLTSLSTVQDEGDEEHESALRECSRSIVGNIDTVDKLISEIANKCTNDKAGIRKESCWMFQILVEERKDRADFYEDLPVILRELVYRLNDDSSDVLKANFAAFKALTKHVPAEEVVEHVEFMQNLMASMVSEARRRKGGVGDGEFLMPGFNMPKGLEPLLPIYQRGILYGTPSIREVSATGLGECISLTASKFLAGPLIIKMTGPLLRIVGDRNPSNVKVAILRTLGLILVKGGPALRAFVPQFQTTFVKALQDQSRQVRLEAIGALGLLMPLSTRVDPLLKELVSGSLGKSGEQIAAVQTATLEALAIVLQKGGRKAKLPDSVPSAFRASQELVFQHPDEGVREAASKVLGATCALLGEETTTKMLEQILESNDGDDDAEVRHGKACACHRVLAASVGSKVNLELSTNLHDQISDLLIEYTSDDKAAVREAACVALGAAVGSSQNPEVCLRNVDSVFLGIMKSIQERMEIHKAVATGLCVALTLVASSGVENKVEFFGRTLLDACLQLAMSGSQRVQFAFNDVLWLALGCDQETEDNGIKGEKGLETYLEMANFDNAKAMKSIHSKVLQRIQSVDLDL